LADQRRENSQQLREDELVLDPMAQAIDITEAETAPDICKNRWKLHFDQQNELVNHDVPIQLGEQK
jgi:hypothetical protein